LEKKIVEERKKLEEGVCIIAISNFKGALCAYVI